MTNTPPPLPHSLSWEQPAPQQRYTPVPGFERPPSMASLSQLASGGPSTPLAEERPLVADHDHYDPESLPPPHRASIYSDPFKHADRPPSQAAQSDTASQMSGYSGSRQPNRSQYANMDSPTGGSIPYGAGGAGAGGAGYAAYRGEQTPYTPSAHENIPADQLWAMEAGKERIQNYNHNPDDAERKARTKKLVWFLAIVAVLAVAGIVAGVVVSVTTKKHHSSSDSSTDSANSGNGSGNNGPAVTLEDPNDPSKFQKDSRLHNVFWGMAYDPDGAILPMCGALQANVTRDIQILSQLTTRLRLYGANCNVTALVLQAIKDTKVDMTIYPAIYVDSNTQAFDDQLKAITNAITTYGEDNIDGIAVGNEYLLNQVGSVNTGGAYTTAVASLKTRINTVNQTITAMNLKKHIPIGTGDAGSVMSVALANDIEFFMANVHPWFGALPISQAASWTYDYFQNNDVVYAKQAANPPEMYIAETGWPTQSMWANTTEDGAGSPQGDASVANLQTFLDTYVCQANANGTKYFYFEPFDQPWKTIFGGVEPYWGLFDSDRNLKQPLTIPTC
ncbi:hypothetical protein Q8F55_007538 [Vanrija albida]|uniref:glucan endo-1,3-beta-D-glucosidase n=1 Tax=Vanrija albida TaxID=181172 RepID=A0ABR3PTZ4_9TREE